MSDFGASLGQDHLLGGAVRREQTFQNPDSRPLVKPRSPASATLSRRATTRPIKAANAIPATPTARGLQSSIGAISSATAITPFTQGL